MAEVRANEEEIEAIQSRLLQGQERMRRIAGYDSSRVLRELQDVERQNRDLDSQLDRARREKSQASQRKQEVEVERDRRASDVQTLQRLLAEAQKKKEQIEKLGRTNRTIFNPSVADSKIPWLVEVSGDGYSVAKWGRSAPPTAFRTAHDLAAFAAERDKDTEYFVLLVKPNGIGNFYLAWNSLRTAGFDVSFDLLAADQTAIDPDTGAAGP